jgi:hypothetical protein
LASKICCTLKSEYKKFCYNYSYYYYHEEAPAPAVKVLLLTRTKRQAQVDCKLNTNGIQKIKGNITKRAKRETTNNPPRDITAMMNICFQEDERNTPEVNEPMDIRSEGEWSSQTDTQDMPITISQPQHEDKR